MHSSEALPRTILLESSRLDEVRYATCIIRMVHELHKAGYQRIRIHPGLSPSGMQWRCNITYADNVKADGFSVIVFDVENGHVAPYTSANGAYYFGWDDGASLNAKQMALRFLETFPIIAENGIGRDWPYAGWLTDVLGRAEQGRPGDVITLYADYDLDAAFLSAWKPPSPSRAHSHAELD